MSSQRVQDLLQHTKETYGESFATILFEQYKLYVGSAERVSERRVSANNFLLTVNASLVTLYGVVAPHAGRWSLLVPLAGLLVSLTWYRIITSYRDLNTVKFAVIHELERQLPAALYGYEWHRAEEGRGRAYRPLTHLEQWVPLIFMALYLALSVIELT